MGLFWLKAISIYQIVGLVKIILLFKNYMFEIMQHTSHWIFDLDRDSCDQIQLSLAKICEIINFIITSCSR